MTKSISDLARKAGHPQPGMDKIFFQRLVDLAIAQYRESLLAGVGDAVITKNTNGITLHIGWDDVPINTTLYTADQLAAAVAIERERCAKVVEEFPHDQLGCLDEVAAAIRGQ